MMMSLKTHTAYPEIQVTEAFAWRHADQFGRADDPRQIPKGAFSDTVYLWEAKIVQQPAETFEEYLVKHCTPKAVTAFRSIMADKQATDAVRKEAMAGIIAYGGVPEALSAVTVVSFTGTATSRQAAIDEAVAMIASVQDEYLKEVA